MPATAQGAESAAAGGESGAGQSLEAAHRELLRDPTLQFQLGDAELPKPRDPIDWPDWLIDIFSAIGDFLNAIAPGLAYVFWGGLILIGLLLIFVIVREVVMRTSGRGGKKTKIEEDAPRPEFRPTQARAKALLEEADRLAREGRYGEAVRVLLHRSIEDIEAHFPISIGLAMTSREIEQIEPLSAHGRAVFTKIARAVEMSLFGGRELDAARYAECRKEYESFAFAGRPA